ncbi:Toll-like receptor 8 [Bulinus truncatus]|nr:Toll-like receptor 8 [Bulinus truncatus]
MSEIPKMSTLAEMLLSCLLVCLCVERAYSVPLVCNTYQNAFPNCSILAEKDNKCIIDCSGLGLTSVPTPAETITDTIFEMRLNNNRITNLKNNSFTGLKITKLDLRDNNISTVEIASFQGLRDYLLYLYLDGNGVSAPPKEALNNLINLQELTLRNYGLTNLPGNSGIFLTFRSLQKLTMDNWKLTNIESGALLGPMNLFSLTLNEQNFVALPVHLQDEDNLKNLNQLTITNTEIKDVTYHAFKEMTKLEVLDLSQNHISTLEEFCFYGLASLQRLNLSGNILSSSTDKMIKLTNLTKLMVLDLSNNHDISSVPDLSQLKSRENFKLYLGRNKIQNLGSDTLKNLGINLHTLDISNNSNIINIDPKAFDKVPSLVYINLSNQALDNNFWLAIKALTKLEVLNLSNTKLTSIPNYIFENMTNLRELDLSSKYAVDANNFQTITPEALVGPYKSLKGLYLSGSGLTTLSPCLFNGYTSFPITMSLGGTYLTCNCDIYWLWLKIKNKNITFLTGEEPHCSSNGKLLSNQEQLEFCSNPPSTKCTYNYAFPKPNITLLVGETNITLSWKLNISTSNIHLTSFNVLLEEENNQIIRQINVTASTFKYIFSGLQSGTQYTVCVTAEYSAAISQIQCSPTKTLSSIQTNNQNSDSSEHVGIIVGCVVGGVILLAILVAIVYLLFIRRKPQQKSDLPEQPRKFATSELPAMTGEPRSFAKPKRVSGSGQRDGNMQVVAISDGQTGPHRVGRAQILNSQSSRGKPQSTSSVSSSVYENDRGALPQVPNAKHQPYQKGYINMGFNRDSYDEIDPNREISL